MTHPLTAILKDVPRLSIEMGVEYDQVIVCNDGPFVRYDAVLAALEAAPAPDLVEAGEIMERLRGEPTWSGIVSTAKDAADLITALIALATAQAAQIKGLEATVAEVTSDRAYIIGANAGWEAAVEQGEATPAAAAMLARVEAAEARADAAEAETHKLRRFLKISRDEGREALERAEADKTALAAERAKVAELEAQIAGLEAKVVELSRERFLADHALVDKYRRGGTGIFKFPDDVSAIIRKLDAAEATAATLRAKVERLRGAVERIDQWADAYPLEVFAEPDFAKADEVLKTAGLSLSAISASNMRHVIGGVKAITRAALEGKANE